ncbi:hypothetical protein MPH_08531 [Macrophomina phaseolina MS6]|uniref:Uncharacterized protein n=1 Tax=Macrophomina phaseolina (strain MS6) TaxID=1126212 RepID=K2SBQ2_MACPH|nr:hypothetical protein MPH_08531 [Macrophomina phaseolina MS6]
MTEYYPTTTMTPQHPYIQSLTLFLPSYIFAAFYLEWLLRTDMADSTASHNPGQEDLSHSDEQVNDSTSQIFTGSTSAKCGDLHLEPPASDSHSLALAHIDLARPIIDDLQSENDRLRQQNRALEDEVAQYQGVRLRDLPEDHITDATAQRLYEGIQDAIEQWVYNVTAKSSATDWLSKYEKRLCTWKQDHAAGRAPPVFEFMPPCFRDARAYKASESIDYFFLSWLIAHSLAMYVFNARYPIGINSEQTEFLNHAVAGMKRLGRHYDDHYIDKWRTQTLTILMDHPLFAENYKHFFDDIYGKIRHHLLQWLPREEVFKEYEKELREDIFREAVILQHKLGLAADDYKVVVGSPNTTSAKNQRATYRNIKTFRPIDGQEVHQVFGTLFPSLCRVDSREEYHQITKPVFIAGSTPIQSPQRSPEPRTRVRSGESEKSPPEPTKKSNDRSSGSTHKSTGSDRDNSPNMLLGLSKFIGRRGSSTH